MSKRREQTIEVAKTRNNRVLRLDHVELFDEDFDWLSKTERLTLCNVKVPAELLSRLEKLWWLDLRGGTAKDLSYIRGAVRLQYLAVNQIRGLNDLSVVSELTNLRYLFLYGLSKVNSLPSFSNLIKLERVEVGQMKELPSLRGILDAPMLRQLELLKKMTVTEEDVSAIKNHPSIREFTWFAEDVPNKVWAPIVDRIGLPNVSSGTPEDWFEISDSPRKK